MGEPLRNTGLIEACPVGDECDRRDARCTAVEQIHTELIARLERDGKHSVNGVSEGEGARGRTDSRIEDARYLTAVAGTSIVPVGARSRIRAEVGRELAQNRRLLIHIIPVPRP